ncbi:MAG TPA: type IV pilus assembly protein PilM [Candidatus Omnitrophota bacterium]|nr:type IV pilus assembly protein PilM [Candidatus Omnitrophota bacterium]
MKRIMAKAEEQFRQEQSIIGIDVGLSSVKVVQLANVNGAMSIVKAALVDIGGLPGDQKEALASLKVAMVGFDVQRAKIVAVINCPQTCTRKIIAPHMPKKELAQAVRWEAKNVIPFSLEGALIDFEILGEISENNVRKNVISVAATPKTTVDKLVSLFAKADIQIAAMIPVSLSLQNLMAHAHQENQILAVVEMGASVTELNIFREGQLAFSRKLPIAGNDITKAMTSALMSSQGKVELSVEEAERIKKEYGIPSGDQEGMIDGKIQPIQLLSLIRPHIEQLASEIDRSFDFFREESRGGKVNKIILFGGGANLKSLGEALKNELEIDIEIGDSFQGFSVLPEAVHDRDRERSRYDLAIGAALSRAEKINLLPIELKEKTKRFIEMVSLKGIGVGIAVSILLFYVGLHIQWFSLNKKMSALRLEERTLAPRLKKLQTSILISGIFKDRPYWEDVLKELSHVVPPEIQMTYLRADDDMVHLKGNILPSGRDSQAVLSGFMLTLEEGIFQDVSLVQTQKQAGKENIAEFEITCKVE